jgi:hypothetical protein
VGREFLLLLLVVVVVVVVEREEDDDRYVPEVFLELQDALQKTVLAPP